MKDKAKIVLHIGAPKTGSTYLQKRLRSSPELLREHGVYYPIMPVIERMSGNAKLLPMVIDRNPWFNFQRAYPNINVNDLHPREVLAELVSGWRREEEVLILSAENFRSYHAETMRDVLPGDVSYTVVLFVRRQDDWIDSFFNQLVKTQNIYEDIGTFVDRVCNSDDDRICCPDWHAHYRAWSESFGACQVVFYDEVRSDLFGAFLTSAGLNSLPEIVEIPPAQVSLGIYQFAYLLEQDRDTPFKTFRLRRRASEKASRQVGWDRKQSLLSSSDREQLRNRFDFGNKQLLSVLGKDGQSDILDIATESENYCDLKSLVKTPEYESYREIADAHYINEINRVK